MSDNEGTVQITAQPGQKVRKVTLNLGSTFVYLALGAACFLIGWAVVVYVL